VWATEDDVRAAGPLALVAGGVALVAFGARPDETDDVADLVVRWVLPVCFAGAGDAAWAPVAEATPIDPRKTSAKSPTQPEFFLFTSVVLVCVYEFVKTGL
jgi:hypothetical protein